MEAIQASINRQADKEDVGQTHRYREIYRHNGILVIKKNEILPFVTTQMGLQAIMLSEISQIKTNTV